MSKKIKSYQEAELIKMFSLTRLAGNDAHPLMKEWTSTTAVLNAWEQSLFEDIMKNLLLQIVGWNEEMLKMNFIAFVLRLGHIRETLQYKKQK